MREVWKFYLRENLLIDLFAAFALIVNIASDNPTINYLKLLVLMKMPHYLGKMEELEGYFIKNLYIEQYWSLIKTLIFNFAFAHIICILLNAMARLSPGANWMIAKGIENSPWLEKYSWSYYWANTIMLTVGFGDIVATNYKEAICLVFIQTFSCMAFAYNICLLYTSPSPRDQRGSRMPSSA